MTGILLSMSSQMSAKENTDNDILNRIYSYQKHYHTEIDSLVDNVYAKLRFNVEKRNSILWLIPTMYVMAKDEHEYLRESYAKVLFTDTHHFKINSQVLSGTISRNRKAMPTLIDYMTPNIYDVALYDGHMLSPFNKTNRMYYRFAWKQQKDGTTRMDFKPKIYNTQLLNGYAIIETGTGRILKTMLNGEFDMISFRTEIFMGEKGAKSLMPDKCNTTATFKFMGNRISVLFDANYDCPISLPDSIGKLSSREVMDSIRPIPLSETDKAIYQHYDEQQQKHKEAEELDTLPKKQNIWKKVFWDTIGDNLVTPIAAESSTASFQLSPIINPLYLSYSESRGLRYKMKLRTRYTFSAHRYLTLNPTLGYNFKQQKFYFDVPLRMTYNPKRNGYAEIVYSNGNLITNSSVMDAIRKEFGDTINFDKTDVDKFDDNQLLIFNNIMLFDWLDIETGIIYHQRKAIDKKVMQYYGMPVEYRSFAPLLGVKIQPWLDGGPLISIDWERAIKGINHSNLEYERIEIDASWKKKIPGLRVLNLRAGTGFYTNKQQDYFVDFTNFRDENLPEGWDDDWSGDFQLLSSRLYNMSDYYVRGNISYESPMLLATWIPYVGKYIEKERFYLSGVLLQHSRPYYELGYGFTNRYISVGAFASFRNYRFEKFGISFDFELFKRW